MKQPEEIRVALTRQWLAKANEDLEAARFLLARETPLLAPAGFHAQQSTEKYLKAFLTYHQVEFPKTHSIAELLDIVSRVVPALADELDDAVALTPYGVEVRYPGDLPELTTNEARQAVALAEMVKEAILRAVEI